MYTRSILALNKIESGGAAVMFSPGGIGAARDVVARFVAEQGEEAYDPRDWLAPLQRELIAQDAESPSDSGRGTALAEGVGLAADVECLMEVMLLRYRSGTAPQSLFLTRVLEQEGDLVIFDAMSLHTASTCSNGRARYGGCLSQVSHLAGLVLLTPMSLCASAHLLVPR